MMSRLLFFHDVLQDLHDRRPGCCVVARTATRAHIALTIINFIQPIHLFQAFIGPIFLSGTLSSHGLIFKIDHSRPATHQHSGASASASRTSDTNPKRQCIVESSRGAITKPTFRHVRDTSLHPVSNSSSSHWLVAHKLRAHEKLDSPFHQF
ncbi:hypothetical protein K458DRAFT_124674 [Lentithecium fluviatile CBS 122367]|uniref:Uncharacterized protein n=1 Tax=Lentithecium fluviatile CBS 122367 TaxID=1168545 RepID=A0A6G1JG23_9PLEO|nr:hypothetical protein K458DRAFT_124674 [Lentithecium fluviatile CBS 122367]